MTANDPLQQTTMEQCQNDVESEQNVDGDQNVANLVENLLTPPADKTGLNGTSGNEPEKPARLEVTCPEDCRTQQPITVELEPIELATGKMANNEPPLENESAAKKRVLITGCDSGFGHELAKALASTNEYYVFAGCLHSTSEGAESLQGSLGKNGEIFQLDLTNFDEVEGMTYRLKQRMPENKDLYAIVLNAGVSSIGELEWGTQMSLERVFRVNVFGTVHVVRKCLPLLRAHSGSRIVIMGSVAGRISYPGMGIYCMSKHAIRAYADSLRRELYKWRIFVCLVEPVLYKTSMTSKDFVIEDIEKNWSSSSSTTRSAYGEKYSRWFGDQCTAYLNARCQPDITPVVRTLQKAVTTPKPSIYYFCGSIGDRMRLKIAKILPTTLLDRMMRRINQNVPENILGSKDNDDTSESMPTPKILEGCENECFEHVALS